MDKPETVESQFLVSRIFFLRLREKGEFYGSRSTQVWQEDLL